MAEWEAGEFMGQEDSASLREAVRQGLTLATYDRRTIPPLLTISPSDIRGLVRALTDLSEQTGRWDWIDRVYFLRR